MNDKFKPLVGIAIATHNRKEILRECIKAINNSKYYNVVICIVDDGSADGTWKMLNNDFPEIVSIKGDGSLWWGGATNKAIKACLDLKCEHVILLNDDCIIQENTISKFIQCSEDFSGAVIAPVVLDINHHNKIWWAGSTWGPVKFFPFIWLIRQKYTHHALISELPNLPYNTSEFTGRATFIPRSVFESMGLIDAELFPQYGSDNDFSLRITTGGGRAIVDPNNRVFLYTEKAGQDTVGNLLSLPVRFFKLMFYRKNGEVARFWWHILKRHAPWYAVIPSYAFILMLTFLRVFKILPIIYRFVGYKNR